MVKNDAFDVGNDDDIIDVNNVGDGGVVEK